MQRIDCLEVSSCYWHNWWKDKNSWNYFENSLRCHPKLTYKVQRVDSLHDSMYRYTTQDWHHYRLLHLQNLAALSVDISLSGQKLHFLWTIWKICIATVHERLFVSSSHLRQYFDIWQNVACKCTLCTRPSTLRQRVCSFLWGSPFYGDCLDNLKIHLIPMRVFVKIAKFLTEWSVSPVDVANSGAWCIIHGSTTLPYLETEFILFPAPNVQTLVVTGCMEKYFMGTFWYEALFLPS